MAPGYRDFVFFRVLLSSTVGRTLTAQIQGGRIDHLPGLGPVPTTPVWELYEGIVESTVRSLWEQHPRPQPINTTSRSPRRRRHQPHTKPLYHHGATQGEIMTPDQIYQILGSKPIRVIDNGTRFNLIYPGNLCQSYTKNTLLLILLKENS